MEASSGSKCATTSPFLEPARGEVLVKVAAAGVNNTDINTRIGWYAPDVVGATPSTREDIGWSGDVPTFPRIQGADACGRIVVGRSRRPIDRIGERIIVEPVFRDRGIRSPVYFGSEVDGAFAEYTVVPSRHAVRVDCAWTRRRAGIDPVLVLRGREHVGPSSRWLRRDGRRHGSVGRCWFCGGATRCATWSAGDRARRAGEARRGERARRRPVAAAR